MFITRAPPNGHAATTMNFAIWAIHCSAISTGRIAILSGCESRSATTQGSMISFTSAGSPDWVIANGDYNCDTDFVGLSAEPAMQSAKECLGKLQAKFGPRFRPTMGDHELGKMSLLESRGGIRLESLRRARELGIEPLWRLDLGNRVLLGVTSTLIALPLFEGGHAARGTRRMASLAGGTSRAHSGNVERIKTLAATDAFLSRPFSAAVFVAGGDSNT